MTKSAYSPRMKTRKTKKRYVLNIKRPYSTMPGYVIQWQHFYCHNRDAQNDMLFLKEMIGDCFIYEVLDASIPNPDAVYSENKMMASQLADLPQDEILYD